MKSQKFDAVKALRADIARHKPAGRLSDFKLMDLHFDGDFNTIINGLMPLAYKYSMAFVNSRKEVLEALPIPDAEFISEGHLAFIQAVKSWNPVKGPLPAWMRLHITSACRKLLQREAKHKAISLQDLEDQVSENEFSGYASHLLLQALEDTDTDTAETGSDARDWQIVFQAMQSLTERQWEALTIRYGVLDDQERTLMQVSREMDISIKNAKVLIDKAISNIQKKLRIKDTPEG